MRFDQLTILLAEQQTLADMAAKIADQRQLRFVTAGKSFFQAARVGWGVVEMRIFGEDKLGVGDAHGIAFESAPEQAANLRRRLAQKPAERFGRNDFDGGRRHENAPVAQGVRPADNFPVLSGAGQHLSQ